MTRILVATTETGSPEDFMTALLPKGLEVYIVEKNSGLKKTLTMRKPDMLIFDADSDEFGQLDGIDELRKENLLEGMHLVVFSHASGIDFVKKTMSMGVVGYIYKPITAEELGKQVDNLIGEVAPGGNRREFVRVQPNHSEKTAAEMLLQGSKSVSADLLDISLGGVALKLRHPERSGSVTIGYNGTVRLFLENEPNVLVEAESVLARGDTIALKFTEMSDEALRILCRYIHNRLRETTEESEDGDQYLDIVSQ